MRALLPMPLPRKPANPASHPKRRSAHPSAHQPGPSPTFHSGIAHGCDQRRRGGVASALQYRSGGIRPTLRGCFRADYPENQRPPPTLQLGAARQPATVPCDTHIGRTRLIPAYLSDEPPGPLLWLKWTGLIWSCQLGKGRGAGATASTPRPFRPSIRRAPTEARQPVGSEARIQTAEEVRRITPHRTRSPDQLPASDYPQLITDFVRLISAVTTECHRARLTRQSKTQPLAFL